jgi:hypothetical protein
MPHTASSTVVSVVKPSGKPQPQDLGVFDFPGGDGARADLPGPLLQSAALPGQA